MAKNLDDKSTGLSVYLSGNGPLVDVLREALKKSVAAEDKEREEILKRAKKMPADHSMFLNQRNYTINIHKLE